MIRRLSWGLGLAAALGACNPAPDRGATVLYASGADLQSINPLLTTHPLARQVQRYVLLTTLARYDSALEARPYLARSWTWSDDRRRLTFALVTTLRWHDGAPTTSRDVQWTLDAARDPRVGYPRQSELADVEAVSAPDDSTVILDFSVEQHRFPDVLTDLAILPAHLLDSVPLDALRRAEWNQRPVGNGPFRFVRHDPNRRWVFAANPDFPSELGGPPRLERLVLAVVDEPVTKLAALVAGELDFAGIQPAHAAYVRRDSGLDVLDYPLLFTYGLVFNTRRPPFDRLDRRLAVSAALNRRELVDGYVYGFGTPATGPMMASAGANGPKQAVPAESRRERAGAGTSSRGPSENPGTGEAAHPASSAVRSPLVSPPPREPIPFELLSVGSGDGVLEQMIQAQLARAGFQVTLRQLELSAFLDRLYGPSHDFDAAVLGIPGDIGLGYLGPLAALTGIAAPRDTEAALRLFADSMPVAFLYHARGVQGMNRRVHGVHMDLRGELVTVHDWWASP
ncbi:MAG TPA: ABC transporter substrate-binding protein [Gemmatimonadales bacterium]|nr:ABC transporter substrate-binding protein [Gemmatimonadales bacterium]